MTDPKLFSATILSIAYFGLFSLLDMIAELSTGYIVFFMAVSCFEYLGLEKLFCTTLRNKTAVFKTAEFIICSLFVPLCVYVLAAAIKTEMFCCSAWVCLATFVFRSIYGIIILFNRKGS